MAKKKEVYKVKPLNENKKNIIAALLSTSMISRPPMIFRQPLGIFSEAPLSQ